ncbi:hypothetical protein [Embleya sp. NPDC005971]|uniref:hypothetical protein n=1 Tax=Embleya sp. NPDC005971 TaxID=3156724 RepID=UPI0033F40E9E
MTHAHANVNEAATDEVPAHIGEFLDWLLAGCDRAALKRVSVELRFRYPADFAKLLAVVERTSPAQGAARVVVDALTPDDADAKHLLDVVCRRHYGRPDLQAARRERAGRLQSRRPLFLTGCRRADRRRCRLTCRSRSRRHGSGWPVR